MSLLIPPPAGPCVCPCTRSSTRCALALSAGRQKRMKAMRLSPSELWRTPMLGALPKLRPSLTPAQLLLMFVGKPETRADPSEASSPNTSFKALGPVPKGQSLTPKETHWFSLMWKTSIEPPTRSIGSSVWKKSNSPGLKNRGKEKSSKVQTSRPW